MDLFNKTQASTDRLWVTWEIQRRNRTTSTAVGAELHEFDIAGSMVSRYLRASVRTLRLFSNRSPRVVFAQNPSIVLATITVIYGRVRGVATVVDSHNAAIERLGDANFLGSISRWLVRNAFLTLVSNDALARVVEEKGGRAAVLPDPLPTFRSREPIPLKGLYNALFVCTWADDEPYKEVIRAAQSLPGDIHIYVTGKSGGREKLIPGGVPENVTLTGFVPEDTFEDLLHSVDLVVDLTTRQDCLVCGGYEAVAAGTPILLSDTRALRQYFDAGALFTDNSECDISRKILASRVRQQELELEIRSLRDRIPRRWNARLRALEGILSEWE